MKPALKLVCLLLLGVAIALVAAAVLWWVKCNTTQNASAPTPLSGRRTSTASSPADVEALTRTPGQLEKTTSSSKKAPSPAGIEAHLAVNPDQNVGFAERVAAIHSLKTELNATEVNAFSQYLRTPAKPGTRPAGEPQDRDSENWLRNEMMDKLVQQAATPPGLSDLLVAIYQDPAQDVVMRDYAVQHMTPTYGQVSDQEKSNLRNALWQAVGETDTSIAGTAMLALLDISGGSATPTPISEPMAGSLPTTQIDRAQLAQTALKLAADDHCGELARITAVQVCGRMGVDQALPVVEQLAQGASSTTLRIAATAALGDIGGTGAEDVLKRLAASADPLQVLAAQSALRRLARAQTVLAKH